jgi:hypothetical protein
MTKVRFVLVNHRWQMKPVAWWQRLRHPDSDLVVTTDRFDDEDEEELDELDEAERDETE